MRAHYDQKDGASAMLDRIRGWLSDEADQEKDDTGWGLPLWWGAVVVALFTIAITWCHDPAAEIAAAAPPVTADSVLPPAQPSTPDLVSLIEEQPDLSFFRSLITVAGVDEPLATQGQFTFFAPSDAAFAALSDGVREMMLTDSFVADQVLQTHVAFGRISAADLLAVGSVDTVVGQTLSVAATGGDVTIGGVSVVAPDLEATNGLVHVVDGVLDVAVLSEEPPPPSEPEAAPVSQIIAERADLSTLGAALGALEGDLFEAGVEGFTTFAPTDTAFGSLPAGSIDVLLATQPKLLELLGYHVVPGTLLSSDLTDGQVLTTGSGAELPISIVDGEIMVGGAVITEADLVGSNGVVHIVDGVLIPPDFELPTVNEALGLDPITFQTGSAVITEDGVAVLDRAVGFLEANVDVRVAIEGHTDSQGGEQSNQRLSEARAQAVLDFLVERGIAADRLQSAGFGESRPIAPNDTADGRAQNRRIEFRLIA